MKTLKQIEVDKKQKGIKAFFEIKSTEIEARKRNAFSHYNNGWNSFGNVIRFNFHIHDRFVNDKIIKRERPSRMFSYKDILFFPIFFFKNL